MQEIGQESIVIPPARGAPHARNIDSFLYLLPHSVGCHEKLLSPKGEFSPGNSGTRVCAFFLAADTAATLGVLTAAASQWGTQQPTANQASRGGCEYHSCQDLAQA